jgi:tRNA-splicing ligase RtcB (3'-phosphate/5'-hydroxy nucleic acid ligase)
MTDNTYNVITPSNGVPIKAWTKGVPLEDAARQQLLNVAQLPFIYKWVAAMPDVHWGIGATVGSVIPTRGAIIPAAVGVDIGCGMMAVQTSLHANHLPDNLHGIRTAIEKAVPHGRTDNGGKNDRGAWSDAPARHLEVWAKMEPAYTAIVEKYPKLTMCSASITWERLVPGTTSSRSPWMRTRMSGSCCTRDRVAWGIGSARFSSSWRRTTCASG